MAELQARAITKRYNGQEIIRDVSIRLGQGELVSLLGVSGVGKTTLFNVLSGLEVPDRGQVTLDGEDITGAPGRVSYMLQKDLLLPHKKIADNVALPLILRGEKKQDARREAVSHFARFGLAGTEEKYPAQLSGGMRQRAALLRTFLGSRGAVLLDEPFSALDYQTRLAVSADIHAILRREQLTALLVTHDIAEAVSMSDRIFILSRRPAVVKKVHDLTELAGLTPLQRRDHPLFHTHFNAVWKEVDLHV